MKHKQKAAKQDFNKTNLPTNRKELFSFLFKNNRRELFYIGLVLLLSFLPILIGLSFYTVMANILYSDYVAKASQLSGDALAALKSQYQNSYLNYTDIFSWAMVLGFVLLALGLSGVFTDMRDYAYREPYFFKDSMIKGIRQNFLQFMIVFLIYGLINVFSVHFFALNINEYLRVIPLVLQYVVLLPVAVLMCLLSSIYKEKIWTIFFMAFRLYIGKLWQILLLSLMVLFIDILLVIPNVASFMSISICYPIFALFTLFGEPILLLIYFLNLYNILDQTINAKNYPSLVGKGLH